MTQRRPKRPIETPHLPGETTGLWHRPPRLRPFEDRPDAERLEAVWNQTWTDTAERKRMRDAIIGWRRVSLAGEGRNHALLVGPALSGATGTLAALKADFASCGLGELLIAAMPATGAFADLTDAIIAATGTGNAPAARQPGHMREFHMYEVLRRSKPAGIALDRGSDLMALTPERRVAVAGELMHVCKRARIPFILAVPPRLGAALLDAFNHGASTWS